MWILNSERPIYLQLMDEMKRRIIIGDYHAGDRLPSVRELAEAACVNPNTMQKAMTELERTGLVFSQRTNGRYITEDQNMIEQLKTTFAEEKINTFLESMKQYGYDAKTVAELILTSQKHTKKGEDTSC